MTRAQSLRQETALNSITPERAGGIMYDTAALLNQQQLQGTNPLLISKIYASIEAMEADDNPVSDITGEALKPGQIVVISSAQPDEPDEGLVYRFNGIVEEASSWTCVGKIGSSPYLEGYQYMGKAVLTPTPTDPGVPTQKVFYQATEPGTYTNFGGIVVADGEVVNLKWDGTAWSKEVTGAVSAGALEAAVSDLEDKVFLIENPSPYSDPDVLSYLTDANGRVFAIFYKDGSIKKLALNADEKAQKAFLESVSSPAPHSDPEILKYLTDETGRCFGYVKNDGTVFLYKARIANLDANTTPGGGGGGGADEAALSAALGLVAVGVDNVEMSNNPRMMAVLKNLRTPEPVQLNADNENKINLTAKISIIDDDTIDFQIPSSRGASDPSTTTGGYFSVLLPLLLSLQAKNGRPTFAGVACEGHRVGLTSLRQDNDDYSALNENGNAVKWLHDHMGWNVLNHSMTAQLPHRTYYVDGIDSALAATILEQGEYHGTRSFENTIVLDRLTGKWYEVNSTLTAWVERTPFKKYALPFYREYINASTPSANHDGPLYFNRDFDFEYSWGEWNKRAAELGLPFEKVIVFNGSTTTPYTIAASRKYGYFGVSTRGTYNFPPLGAAVCRTGMSASNNVWSDAWVESRKEAMDNCAKDRSWVVFMTHIYEAYSRNYYVDGNTYPTADPDQPVLRAKDDNYPDAWRVPLTHEEIQDIIGANVNDYINTPPSRLGITSWADWHPAGGTMLAAFYYVLDYAMGKGIDIVPPMDGWKTHGNVLNIGVDRNGQTYPFDTAEAQTPLTDDEKSYLTIGADMTIRIFNSKQ